MCSDGSRIVARVQVCSVETGVIQDQVYALRMYSRADLSSLMRRAGFEVQNEGAGDVLQGGKMHTSDQNMGFLEHRMLLVGKKPSE